MKEIRSFGYNVVDAGGKILNVPQKKAWGTTRLIMQTPCFELHRLEIMKGGYCSRHFHKSKFNGFYIERGHLGIETFGKHREGYGIAAGEHMIICPGVEHRFNAIEDTTCYEIYWSEFDPKDIERIEEGGYFVPPF